MTQKEELRKNLKMSLREKFAAASPDEIRHLSLAALRNIISLHLLRPAQKIMLYAEMPREFPATPFMPLLLAGQACTLVLPWCEENSLRLFRLASSDELKNISRDFPSLLSERLEPGAYGIREPKKHLRSLPDFTVEPSQIDLVILPGLGFDRQCRRLGRGKGYYDRFLPKLRKETILIGIGFDEQIAESVPTEPHDRTLHYVVTPTRIFTADATRRHETSV